MLSPAKLIDHTLLKAGVTRAEINQLCEEAVENGFASVCIPPVYVSEANQLLYGSEVSVCTVVGFPFGYQSPAAKVFETQQAIAEGADEIDMVIQLGAAQTGDYRTVLAEIIQIVAASGTGVVKVILECCLFDDGQKRSLVEAVLKSGADYVKTSTGFSTGGATLEDVRLLSALARKQLGVKASGGIRDWPTCQAMIQAGATRIGTSAGIQIMQQWRQAGSGE
jgi:deoxyribose-phosphate aldolase